MFPSLIKYKGNCENMRFFKRDFFLCFHENESSTLQVMHRERLTKGSETFIKRKQNQGRKAKKVKLRHDLEESKRVSRKG